MHNIKYGTTITIDGSKITVPTSSWFSNGEIYAVPDETHEFDYWLYNGQQIKEGSISVTDDTLLTAVFKIKTFKVSFDVDDASHGKTSAAALYSIPYGADYRILNMGGIVQFS